VSTKEDATAGPVTGTGVASISDGGAQAAEPEIGDWEFRGTPPTVEDVLRLLGTLPDVYGVRYVDYADWVQALPQTKKIQNRIRMPNGTYRTEDQFIDTWVLYMGVAGRVKMINDAAVLNEWWVDFEPEPVTPTGIPGMLQYDDKRIVYREHLVIGPYVEGKRQEPRSRKPGTAWVPSSGGRQAAGSNPLEVVETSARGRAIAAFGIGVLPGSGIASLEEMLGAAQNERAMQQQAAAPQEQRQSRDEIMEQVRTASEQIRQLRGLSEDDQMDKIGSFLTDRLGIPNVYNAELRVVNWAAVKDGQAVLLLNSLRDGIRTLQAQQEPV
jgi:hypothetical protein